MNRQTSQFGMRGYKQAENFYIVIERRGDNNVPLAMFTGLNYADEYASKFPNHPLWIVNYFTGFVLECMYQCA